MGYPNDKAAKCPYYVRSSGKSRITCEGTISAECIMCFGHPAACRQHFNLFCRGYDWAKCPHAAVVQAKYKEDDES